MKNRLIAIRQSFFSFFLAPASLTPLTFLRISFSVFCICMCLSIYPYIQQLYGSEGYIQWVISDHLFAKAQLPTLHNLYNWVQHAGGYADEQVVRGAYLIYMLCLFCIGVGFYSNFFSFVAWFLHLMFLNTGSIYGYGVESFVHIILFYFIFMPVDAQWALSAFWKKYTLTQKQKHAIFSRLSIRLLQLHLCIIYLNAGIAKMWGTQWWNGEAMWRSLTQFHYNKVDVTWLAHYPAILTLLGWLVLMLEAGYAIFIWLPSRKFFLLGIVMMHLGISLLMGLYFFGAVMILINVAAFGFSLTPRLEIANNKLPLPTGNRPDKINPVEH